MAKDNFKALGLMSGTSMDGIDVAWLETDGDDLVSPGPSLHVPYDGAMRTLLHEACYAARALEETGVRTARPGVLHKAEQAITRAHAEAVRQFMDSFGLIPDVIGFHGQTVLHRPELRLTVQLGDGNMLAEALSLPVIWDMRAADVEAGGQGAPLAPVYHRALALKHPLPAAFVNIGGVANITFIGEDDRLIAFDCGPGNALVDDWMRRHGRGTYDKDGRTAASGIVHDERLHVWLAHPFLHRPPPKSLDRNDFDIAPAEGLSLEDGAATLTMLTVRCIAEAASWLPAKPRTLYVCGGGRRNRTLMTWLAETLDMPVVPVEVLGVDGDMIEAQCWAYLAVRSLKKLPITFPETTGAPMPLTGGRLSMPKEAP